MGRLGLALLAFSSCSAHERDLELATGGYVAPAPTAASGMPYTSKYPEIESSVLALERESVGMTAPFSQDELMLVLQYHCGECHFPSPCGTSDCGLQYMDDMAKLVETGKVIPGDGEASRLVLRMRRGEMPPLRSAVPPVPPASIERIARYIDVLTLPAPPAAEDPLAEERRRRPNVPPVDVPCFQYLGDWIRCEETGYGFQVDVPGGDLDRCLQACRERTDCVSVTDYTWLGYGGLGCYIELGSCAAPSGGVWQEEDAGRQYLKTCASD